LQSVFIGVKWALSVDLNIVNLFSHAKFINLISISLQMYFSSQELAVKVPQVLLTSGAWLGQQLLDDVVVSVIACNARVFDQLLFDGDADILLGQQLLQLLECLQHEFKCVIHRDYFEFKEHQTNLELHQNYARDALAAFSCSECETRRQEVHNYLLSHRAAASLFAPRMRSFASSDFLHNAHFNEA
jgi:hypothetical protein